jgi:integrase
LEIDVRIKIDLAAAVAASDERPAADITLRELILGYNTSTAGDYDWRLRKWIDAFGHISAWDITSEQLDLAAQAMLSHGYKPSTVNRDLSALGTCYRWARQQRLSPRGFRSPTLSVMRLSEDIRRVEVSADEIERLRRRSLTVRDRRFGVFVALLVDTGARKSELLERRWSEVNLTEGTILCPTTKTGVPRILHFQPSTADLMRRIYRSMPADRLLFEGRLPDEPVSYRAAWKTVTRDIGRPDLHMHDIRHAAAADLLRSGVTLGVAAQVLGHSTLVLTRRYGHLETGALRQAQQTRWDAAA